MKFVGSSSCFPKSFADLPDKLNRSNAIPKTEAKGRYRHGISIRTRLRWQLKRRDVSSEISDQRICTSISCKNLALLPDEVL